MRLRREQKPTPSPWLIDIQPDTVVDREWEEDGNFFRVGKPGWSYVARRARPLAHEVGTADSYEEVLALARKEIAEREAWEADR